LCYVLWFSKQKQVKKTEPNSLEPTTLSSTVQQQKEQLASFLNSLTSNGKKTNQGSVPCKIYKAPKKHMDSHGNLKSYDDVSSGRKQNQG
jgi:hypothetical protein